MKPISYALAAVLVVAFATAAVATPVPNGATLALRVFNDCPFSLLSTTNNYPALISMTDQNQGCVGFANLHNWQFSEDGGATDAVFNNGDSFRFCADLMITGDGEAETGLMVAPWWSQEVDGRFMVRTTDGEIACFGGRLPFFLFNNLPGLAKPLAVKGVPIHLEIIYRPNGLSMASPATIEYNLVFNGTPYTSGQLAFDQGNPAEDPPYGQWGMLNNGRAGGFFQFLVGASFPMEGITVDWANICYEVLQPPIPVEATSWGRVKRLYE